MGKGLSLEFESGNPRDVVEIRQELISIFIPSLPFHYPCLASGQMELIVMAVNPENVSNTEILLTFQNNFK